ncbi:Spondin_N [Alteromonadaceae bacterium Bs31]|nr:Spondin_N [Alteromonadaceae bacterium Bs31]
MKLKRIALLTAAISTLSFLTACGGDDDDDTQPTPEPTMEPTAEPMRSFTIELKNTTNAQPLAPAGILVHEAGSSAWSIGSAASAGLEVLAESGSPADFVAEQSALAAVSGTEVLVPGQSVSFDVDVAESSSMSLTLASMLVNTNDAFTGVSDWDIADLAMGESKQVSAHIYDAGTEANSETAATIPGPAAGGEGFNAARDDVDFVAMHPGVVTQDDGLSSSALTEAHRFNNGAVLIRVTRTH